MGRVPQEFNKLADIHNKADDLVDAKDCFIIAIDHSDNHMTIRIQPPGMADWILCLFGKKRAVFIPMTPERYGIYIARRENFFRALLRPRNAALPKGWKYWEADTELSNDKK